MRLITARTVARFAEGHASSRQAFADWCAIIEAATWEDAAAIKRTLPSSARPIGNHRCIFEIARNEFRIVTEIQYADPSRGFHGRVMVQFVGTHAEYDMINAETVTLPPSRSK